MSKLITINCGAYFHDAEEETRIWFWKKLNQDQIQSIVEEFVMKDFPDCSRPKHNGSM